MAWIKIPCILYAMAGFQIAVTPPHPPPPEAEQISWALVEILLKQRSGPFLVKVFCFVHAFRYAKKESQSLCWAAALSEILVIFASYLPECALSRVILDVLVHEGSNGIVWVSPLFVTGIVLTAVGAGIRYWCYCELGNLFTFEVSIRNDHRLVQSGPYDAVRHPGYTGIILAVSGVFCFSFAPGSWIQECGVLDTLVGRCAVMLQTGIVAFIICGLILRTNAEDKLLEKHFGDEWVNWSARVPYKLIPVTCPICSNRVESHNINAHIDQGCRDVSAEREFTSQSKPKLSSQSSDTSDVGHRKKIAPIFNSKSKPAMASQSSALMTPTALKRKTQEAVPKSVGDPPAKRSKTTLQDAAPLAEKLRPVIFKDFVGHHHVVDLIRNGFAGSVILWGPSGCGKTTLARLIATQTDAVFKELSATTASINDVRAIVDAAKSTLALTAKKTVLFFDENRGELMRDGPLNLEQDIFLPSLEKGYIQLIGATTENPSFKLNGALLSRCRVFALDRLQDRDIQNIVTQSLDRLSRDAGSSHGLADKVVETIVRMSSGDARVAISLVEIALKVPEDCDEAKTIALIRRSAATNYDTAEDHYNLISALHKSIRGSQADAALYWLARMLTGGDDPVYICRRLVVCASEDIGLADSHALPLATATLTACQHVGMPECRINLAHLVVYLSKAPKSTVSYEAYKKAEAAALEHPTLAVPLAVRNAPTGLMESIGYGEGYRYNPDYAHPVTNTYLPPELEARPFLRKDGEMAGKMWDEAALVAWETKENDGKQWEGRFQA
ncbi:unnamed protein product [Mycena citricolor]|uniref:Protein-S-isoprenylcysteine O-methyltransferase n=1 Tax=Mycena citricolor TaxID=2018698 RepID=A0AAD2HSQ3_9AGAR|nr:unnamed protein product [Mycena citricolor]